MNKIHSKVWNASLGALVVASELARSAGKKSGGGIRRSHAVLGGIGVLACAITTLLLSPAAHADVCRGTFAPGTGPTAATTAFACGTLAAATGDYATAFGNRSLASGDYAACPTSNTSGWATSWRLKPSSLRQIAAPRRAAVSMPSMARSSAALPPSASRCRCPA